MSSGYFPIYGDEAKPLITAMALIQKVCEEYATGCQEQDQADNAYADGCVMSRLELAIELIKEAVRP